MVMRSLPRIGITCDRDIQKKGGPFSLLREDYAAAISDLGGVPVLLPALPTEPRADETLDILDGLLVSGGGIDVDPRHYGERPHPKLGPLSPVRTRFELDLIRRALDEGAPILGICGGCQALNVVAGGTLFQDLAAQAPGALRHRAPRSVRHGVSILKGSKLARFFRGLTGRVNTSHHQAVKEVAPSFRSTAWAGDDVIEAIEGDHHPFAIGVQWHPELLYRKDAAAASLFKAFLQAAKTFSKGRHGG